MNEEIRKSGIAKKDISIYIKEAGRGGKVVASLNAHKTRIPASVIKVLTTYASILKLGFDYRWPTKFYTTGRLQNGVLQGDLLIKGFGDPTLRDKDLEKIVSTIRAEGIRQIRGDIVIDRSYFKIGNKDSSGFDEHPYSAYNAMPDAMMFNERLITVSVTPNKNEVYKKNVDESYRIVNQLQPVNKPCKGRYSWPGVRIDKSEVIPTVLLKGKISKRCGKRNISKVVTKPYKSFYYALKDRLKDEGVVVRGSLKLRKIPKNAAVLFTHYSDTLEEIVSETNKKSNNLYARHLLLLLGKSIFIKAALIFSVFLTLLSMWVKKLHSSFAFVFGLKIVFLLFVLRFGAVIFIYSTQMFYNQVYSQQYDNSTTFMSSYKSDLEVIQKEKKNLESHWSGFEDKMEVFSKKVIKLITIFVVTTILFPLLFLWFYLFLIKWTFNQKFDSYKTLQYI